MTLDLDLLFGAREFGQGALEFGVGRQHGVAQAGVVGTRRLPIKIACDSELRRQHRAYCLFEECLGLGHTRDAAFQQALCQGHFVICSNQVEAWRLAGAGAHADAVTNLLGKRQVLARGIQFLLAPQGFEKARLDFGHQIVFDHPYVDLTGLRACGGGFNARRAQARALDALRQAQGRSTAAQGARGTRTKRSPHHLKFRIRIGARGGHAGTPSQRLGTR